MGELLEGQQLHASGFALEKCLEKNPKPSAHTHTWAHKVMGQFFLGRQKKKKRRNQAPFKGEVGGTSLLLPQIQGTQVGWA